MIGKKCISTHSFKPFHITEKALRVFSAYLFFTLGGTSCFPKIKKIVRVV